MLIGYCDCWSIVKVFNRIKQMLLLDVKKWFSHALQHALPGLKTLWSLLISQAVVWHSLFVLAAMCNKQALLSLHEFHSCFARH